MGKGNRNRNRDRTSLKPSGLSVPIRKKDPGLVLEPPSGSTYAQMEEEHLKTASKIRCKRVDNDLYKSSLQCHETFGEGWRCDMDLNECTNLPEDQRSDEVKLRDYGGRISDFFRDCLNEKGEEIKSFVIDSPEKKKVAIECLRELYKSSNLLNTPAKAQILLIIGYLGGLMYTKPPGITESVMNYCARMLGAESGEGNQIEKSCPRIRLPPLIEYIAQSHVRKYVFKSELTGFKRGSKKKRNKRKKNKRTKRIKPRSKVGSKRSKTKRIRKIR
jgi:hypothetical protein